MYELKRSQPLNKENGHCIESEIGKKQVLEKGNDRNEQHGRRDNQSGDINIGWMGWAKNGGMSGSAGYAYRLEGIQIVLVPHGAKAPAATYQGIKANTNQAFRQK